MHNMSRILYAASAAGLLCLAACEQEPETITAGPPDPQAAELAKAKPVALPPSIASSGAYRCKDNSLIYVDLMSDKKTAYLRSEKGGTPTILTAVEAGQPYTAEGYSLTGDAKQVTLTAPGKGTQACHA